MNKPTWLSRNLALQLIVGVLVLIGGFWAGISAPRSSAQPEVVTGTVHLVSLGDRELLFQPRGSTTVHSYQLVAAPFWRDTAGVWRQSGRPACLKPLSSRKTVTLGIITAQPSQQVPGDQIVVWVDCAPS